MVVSKAADVALGFQAIADVFGMAFVPLARVRCDLVIPHDIMDHGIAKKIPDIITSIYFRTELESLPGYEANDPGKLISQL